MTDLQPFCAAPDATLYAANKPFRVAGLDGIFATDTRILIRIEDDGRELEAQSGKVPNVAAVIPSPFPEGAVPVPAIGGIPSSICRLCKGSGGSWKKATHECPDCEGEGTYECEHCGSEVDCEECDGEGECPTGKNKYEPCSACVDTKGEFVFEGLTIAGKYMAMVAALPGVKAKKFRHYLVFQFDGGMGVVMPLT